MSNQPNPHDALFRTGSPHSDHRREEAYVATAEMLRAEGVAHGRAEALVEQLTLKFGPLPQAAVDAVHAAANDQLRAWSAQVLTATTLEQALR